MMTIVWNLVLCAWLGPHAISGTSYTQTFHPLSATIDPIAQHLLVISTSQETSCPVTVKAVNQNTVASFDFSVSSSQPVAYKVNIPSAKGVWVNAQCDITLYGHTFHAQSADGWLAIPDAFLGTEYWVLGVEPWMNELVQLSIGAVENDTFCETTFPNATVRKSSLAAMGIDYITSNRDVTGSRIVCNKRVSVFSGQRCSQVPAGCQGCDHTVEQLPPKTMLGRNHAICSIRRLPATKPLTCCTDKQYCPAGGVDVFRVMAVEANTLVAVYGQSNTDSYTLNAGESRYVLLPRGECAHISSDKSIIAGQYASGGNYAFEAQDPFFGILQPVEAYQSSYRFASCFLQFQQHYIDVAVRAGEGKNLLMNGAAFLTNVSPRPVPNSQLEVFQVRLNCASTTQSFLIEHPGKLNFGVFTYGFNPFSSYGYAAGRKFDTDLSKLCARPTIETAPITLEQCDMAAAAEVPPPAIYTDDACCNGKGSLTFTDRVASSSECNKQIVRTWTLTDGCQTSVSADQAITVTQKMDMYVEPSDLSPTSCDNFDVILAGLQLASYATCGTTLKVDYTDDTDHESYCDRTWAVTQKCSSGTFTYSQSIDCSSAPDLDETPEEKACSCHCRKRPTSKRCINWQKNNNVTAAKSANDCGDVCKKKKGKKATKNDGMTTMKLATTITTPKAPDAPGKKQGSDKKNN